jgi:hypothetical protein
MDKAERTHVITVRCREAFENLKATMRFLRDRHFKIPPLTQADWATLEQAASEKHYLMKPPADGKGLLHYRFTRRKKELLTFEAAESGMTAYVCCRYENAKGETGQWGPVVSAVIP